MVRHVLDRNIPSKRFAYLSPLKSYKHMKTTATKDLDLAVAEAFDELVSYISEHFGQEWVPNLPEMALALDHIYRPVPGFWGEFSYEMVNAALDEACPDWEETLSMRGQDDFKDFLFPVLKMLNRRGFDEAIAEELLKLPVTDRPTDADGVFELMRANAAKQLEADPNNLVAQFHLEIFCPGNLVRAESAFEYARRLAAAQ